MPVAPRCSWGPSHETGAQQDVSAADPGARFCETRSVSRRRFLANTGAAALAFSIVKPEQVRGSTANSAVTLGVIGCGGRGTWIADLFQKHGGYRGRRAGGLLRRPRQ